MTGTLFQTSWTKRLRTSRGISYARNIRRCDVSKSHVLGVVSFYTMYHTKPPGKYHVQVCRNISCHIMGGAEIRRCLEEKLGLKSGELSEDGRFSFEEVECMGACSWAPMMTINETYHQNLTPEKAESILDALE